MAALAVMATVAEEAFVPHSVVVFVAAQVRPTEPEAPAVKVIWLVVAPAVMVPLLMVQV